MSARRKLLRGWGNNMGHNYSAAVTCLALLTYFVLVGLAGQARSKYGIKAPAVAGHEQYERAYRVQMNTLENMAFFLPSMWLYAIYLNDAGAAVGGVIWVAARIYYAASYLRDPATRGPGALLTVLAQFGLFLGAAYGIVKALL
jgi:glutathione S-transferase